MSLLLLSSSTQKESTLTHFSHDRHPLRVVSNEYEFICDGCNTPGAGERYHCKECKFDLHNECAMSPANLSSHMHPIHTLVRTWDRPDDAASTAVFSRHRPCSVCGEQVNGLFFACPVLTCNFFLHPICSEFPQHVNHAIDKQHPLTFQYANKSECKICGDNCTAWRYRCEPCHIDIHLECIVCPHPPVNLEGQRSCMTDRRPRPQHDAEGMPSAPSSQHYGQQPFNNHGPYKPEGGYGNSSEGSNINTGGSRRKRMFEIVRKLLSATVVSTIIGIPNIIDYLA